MKLKSEIKIQNAFFSQLKMKEFDQITIKDIVSTAQINRSTFYAHFYDKYDLWEKIEKSMLDEIQTACLKDKNTWGDFWDEEVIKTYLKDGRKMQLLSLNYIYEHHHILSILTSSNAPKSFITKVADFIGTALDFISIVRSEKYKYSDYVEAIFIGNIIYPIFLWIRKEEPERPEDFFRTLIQLRLRPLLAV